MRLFDAIALIVACWRAEINKISLHELLIEILNLKWKFSNNFKYLCWILFTIDDGLLDRMTQSTNNINYVQYVFILLMIKLNSKWNEFVWLAF